MATAAEVETLRERLIYDTPFWASNCAWIVNKQRKLQRLTPLPWQARTPETPAHVTPLDEALEKQRLAGQPMRALIGKSRKLGMSTWVQAKSVQRVTQLPFQFALTVAHLRSATAALSDMAKLMYDRLPSDPMLADLIYGQSTTKAAPFSVKPQLIGQGTARNGARFFTVGDRMRPAEGSTYETMTAGAKGGGRATTPSMIHASEFAHWEDPDYSVGLFNALPLEPETIGIIESTANGFNHFWRMWDQATRGAADSETGALWMPLFYGWQDNPANSLPFVSEKAEERFDRTVGDAAGGGDPEEVELAEVYGVTLEQLHWRREKINGPECNGDIEKFHQEEPATPEQMFIGSGRPVFPGILVARAIREAETSPRPAAGVLRGLDWRERKTRSGSVLVPQTALWVPSEMVEPVDTDRWGSEHQLRVWQHPLNEVTQSGLAAAERRPDGQYVAFVDISRGRDNTTEDRDWQAIQVLDHVTRRQVASYRSRVPIHDLPILAYLIALYYNEAWLAIETTGLGIGVLDALSKDYRYRALYRRHRSGDDERADARERLLGWEMTLRTKPLMEQTFGQVLREGEHGLRDVETGRQFTTYVEDPKNPAKHGAQKGAHDDLAIAFMGAHRIAAELRPRDTGKKRSRDRWMSADDVAGY